MPIVYKLTCRDTGKSYIGITVRTLEKRWQAHVTPTNLKKKEGALQCAILKYGSGAFDRAVIETTETPAQAAFRERELIIEHRTLSPSGYNLTTGGEMLVGFTHSAETCAKKSNSQRGRKLSEEAKARIGNFHRGRKRSEETRARIGAAKRGVQLSDDHRAKISSANKGRVFSDEVRGNMSAAQKGKKLSDEHVELMRARMLGVKMSDETRAKMSASAKGKIRSQEHRENIRKSKYNLSPEAHVNLSNGQRGRIHSEETRAKMSASAKLRRRKTEELHEPV